MIDLSDIAAIKRKNLNKEEIIIYLSILHEVVCMEDKLIELLKVNKNRLRMLITKFIANGDVTSYIDNKTRILYVINRNQYYKKISDCFEDCKNLISREVHLKNKVIALSECKNNVCNKCSIDVLKKDQFARLVEMTMQKKENFEIENKIYSKKDDKVIETKYWTTKDFRNYFSKNYPRYYEEYIKTKLVFLTLLNPTLVLFRTIIGTKNVGQELKAFIDYNMNKFGNINRKYFHDPDIIRQFVKNKDFVKSEDFSKDVGNCTEYGIKCTYIKSGKCALISSGEKCTKSIRKHMLERYN